MMHFKYALFIMITLMISKKKCNLVSLHFAISRALIIFTDWKYKVLLAFLTNNYYEQYLYYNFYV